MQKSASKPTAEMIQLYEAEKTHNMESWYEELKGVTPRSVGIQLNEDQRDSLAKMIWGEDLTPAEQIAIASLKDKLDEAMKQFPNGAFVKLGSRSPKDSYIAATKWKPPFKCLNGIMVLTALRDSERIFDDLSKARLFGYLPYIWLREWVDIHKEFRTFMHEGRTLKGITQYVSHDDSYKQPFDKAYKDTDVLHLAEKVMNFFLSEKELLNIPADAKLIVDYIIDMKGNVQLLEINPYWNFPMGTDPCLFDWRKDDFMLLQWRFVDRYGVIKHYEMHGGQYVCVQKIKQEKPKKPNFEKFLAKQKKEKPAK